MKEIVTTKTKPLIELDGRDINAAKNIIQKGTVITDRQHTAICCRGW